MDRLKNAIAPAPPAADVFATGDKRLFRKHGRVIGDEVRALGFNVDFAPVSDLAFVAAPLYLLYGLSVILTALVYRRRRKRAAQLAAEEAAAADAEGDGAPRRLDSEPWEADESSTAGRGS